MTQDPGDCNGFFGDAPLLGDLSQDAVELGELLVIDEGSCEHAVLKRAPGLDGHACELRVGERTAITVGRGVVLHVLVHLHAHHAGMAQAELELVDLELLIEIGLEHLAAPGAHVAHADVARHAGVDDVGHGVAELVEVAEGVEAMQEHEVDVVGLQALEFGLERGEQVVAREVVDAVALPGEVGSDAEFGLEDDIVAGDPEVVQGLPQDA